jgi:hypothetical protein
MPSVCIGFQHQFGQWDPVLEAVASDLAALVRAPR